MEVNGEKGGGVGACGDKEQKGGSWGRGVREGAGTAKGTCKLCCTPPPFNKLPLSGGLKFSVMYRGDRSRFLTTKITTLLALGKLESQLPGTESDFWDVPANRCAKEQVVFYQGQKKPILWQGKSKYLPPP